MSFNQGSNFLTIQKRCLFMHVSIFKVKRIAQDSILFHLPSKKCILSVDSHLNNKQKIFHFQDQPQSLQYCQKNGKNYVLGGCVNGVIQGIQYNQGKQKFKIGQTSQVQNYINDLKYLGNGRLANCYNNGTIGLWNLEQQKLITKIPQIHKKYTYKIRSFEERLFSCGNDGYALTTDLQQCQVIRRFKHQSPVWCIIPNSYNQLISVGLFGKVNLWDLRCNRIVQFCPLIGRQTSFVTKFNQNQFILGDQQTLVKCDLRKFLRQQVANSPMILSAQGIQILQDGAIICGRGFQICRFNNSEQQQQIEQQKQGQVIWNPFNIINTNHMTNLFEQLQQMNDELQLQAQQEIQQLEQLQQYNNILNQDMIQIENENIIINNESNNNIDIDIQNYQNLQSQQQEQQNLESQQMQQQQQKQNQGKSDQSYNDSDVGFNQQQSSKSKSNDNINNQQSEVMEDQSQSNL